jgi:hypothetical protein
MSLSQHYRYSIEKTMNADLSLLGKVTPQDVELAADHVQHLREELKHAKSAYREVTWKLRYLKWVVRLEALKTWTQSRILAATIVGTACFGLAAPFLILCQFGILWVYLGMLCAYMVGAGWSLMALYIYDPRTLIERLRESEAQRLARANRAEQARSLYEHALDKLEKLREIERSQKNRLLQMEWHLLRGTPFEEFLAEVFQELGYHVRPKGGPGDQGVDIILSLNGERIAVQAKGRDPDNHVGTDAVQEVFFGGQITTVRNSLS